MPDDLIAQLVTARARLRDVQAQDLVHYCDAYAALGRAAQAAQAGDLAECRRWLHQAEDAEHAVTGAVDCCAAAFRALDRETNT